MGRYVSKSLSSVLPELAQPLMRFDWQWLRPWARLSDHPNPLASDEKLIEDVWKWCEDQVANI